jgi:hypothetical protein
MRKRKVLWVWLAVLLTTFVFLGLQAVVKILGFRGAVVESINIGFLVVLAVLIITAFGMELYLERPGYPIELSEEGTYRVLASWLRGSDWWYFLVRKLEISEGEVTKEGEVTACFAPYDFVYNQTGGRRPEVIQVYVQGTYQKAILYSEESYWIESSEKEEAAAEKATSLSSP